jgi:hypothetical protein
VIFSARAVNVNRVVWAIGASFNVSLDVFLDVSFDVFFNVACSVLFDFGRNNCSTGYTTFASLALTGARQARIEGFGATISFGSADEGGAGLPQRGDDFPVALDLSFENPANQCLSAWGNSL